MITEVLNVVKCILVNHKKKFLLRFGAVQTKFSGAIQVSL